MKKSDPISAPVLPYGTAATPFEKMSPRLAPWRAAAGSNALAILAVLAARWIGYRLEFYEGPAHIGPLRIDLAWSAFHSRIVLLAAIGVIFAVSLQLINGVSGQFSLGHAGFVAIGAYLSGYASSTYGALDPDDAATNFQNVGQVGWYFVSLIVALAAMGAVVSAMIALLHGVNRAARALETRLEESAMPGAGRRIAALLRAWVGPLALLGLLIWATWDLASAANFDPTPPRFLWTRAINGLSTLYSHTLNWGLDPAKRFSQWLTPAIRRPLCFIVLLFGGGAFAGIAGLLVGLPTLRLRGDYLAIATLGFGVIVITIIQNAPAVGGATGLSVTPYYNIANPDGDPVAHYLAPWTLSIMVISVIAMWRISYSFRGQLIRAVREDDIAAAAVGINTTRQKVTAFVIGAFFAGVGGVLLIHREGYGGPDSFGIDASILFVVMVTLGGLDSISGAVLAGATLTIIPFLLRMASSSESLAGGIGHASQWTFLPGVTRRWLGSPDLLAAVRKWLSNQLALFALILIGVMLLRPRGLLGGRELWPRRRWRRSPARPAGAIGA